ncbi:hypothetical protein [Sphingomonas koreensis]|uniref:hypothetical protein n=1 Tax=Sphingomonas koreensis TaxID=93064 RepID=UPI000B1A7E3D|nr:hypothetical protein [Sphingomonas koreensis]PJI87196.1 hypothetical protein BDW16_0426 [Sphingomonas koreensis]
MNIGQVAKASDIPAASVEIECARMRTRYMSKPSPETPALARLRLFAVRRS